MAIEKCETCGKTVEEVMLFNQGNGVYKCREHVNADKSGMAENPVLKDIERIVLNDNKEKHEDGE